MPLMSAGVNDQEGQPKPTEAEKVETFEVGERPLTIHTRFVIPRLTFLRFSIPLFPATRTNSL